MNHFLHNQLSQSICSTLQNSRLQRRVAHFLLLILLLATVAGCRPSHQFTALVSEPPIDVTDFILTGSDGSLFRLSDLRGKYVLLTFGYTSCPDVCPITLAQLRIAREKLGKDAEQVAVLFVSVDPERDSAERVRDYAHAFADDFVGVSGKVAEIDAACAIFGEKYQIDKSKSASPASYEVNHSAYTYVVDPQFRLRLSIPYGAQAEEIASDLRVLMEE